MEQICPPDRCTACAACMNACPKDAIRMTEQGACGYLHPTIDASRCIDCRLCARMCPANHPANLNKPLAAYALRLRDEHNYLTCASGGAAMLLATAILSRGGTVYGCEMENWHTAAHHRYETAAEASRMKASKYVQSTVGLIYRNVKRDLKAGREVLFTGTPCQVAGLKAYLHHDYDNLYTADLVCHGVASQRLLRDNIEAMHARCGLSAPDADTHVTFRRKPDSPGRRIRYGVFLSTDTVPEALQTFPRNDYLAAFMAGLTLRDNCFHCPYARAERVSDITLGDYWGLGDDCRVPRSAGISLTMPITTRGLSLLRAAFPAAYAEERPLHEALHGNGRLVRPQSPLPTRATFIANYARCGQAAYRPALRTYRRNYRLQQIQLFLRLRLRRIPLFKSLYLKLFKKPVTLPHT